MGIRRLLGDLRELHGECARLKVPTEKEQRASFDLAVSARRFSRKATEAADDKLTFTAALMRAGEVEAASRLLAEFEQDVLTEEAALIEQVNEVKVATAIRRERMTKLRLVRLLATALLGASVLAFSAIGMAVAGMLKPPATHAGRHHGGHSAGVFSAATGPSRGKDAKKLRQVRLGHLKIALTASQMQRYRALSSSGADQQSLQNFLLGILPDSLAARMQQVLAATAAVPSPSPDAVVEPVEQKAGDASDDATADGPAPDQEEASPAPDDGSAHHRKHNTDDGSGSSKDGDDAHHGLLPDDPTDPLRKPHHG